MGQVLKDVKAVTKPVIVKKPPLTDVRNLAGDVTLILGKKPVLQEKESSVRDFIFVNTVSQRCLCICSFETINYNSSRFRLFKVTLHKTSVVNCFLANHLILKHLQQNVILSSFCIPKVVKTATK